VVSLVHDAQRVGIGLLFLTAHRLVSDGFVLQTDAYTLVVAAPACLAVAIARGVGTAVVGAVKRKKQGTDHV